MVYLHAWKDEELLNEVNVLRVYSTWPQHHYKFKNPFPFTKYKEGIDNPNQINQDLYQDFDVYGNFRCLPMFYSWEWDINHYMIQ
jgi:hypothetical protein